MACAEAGAEYMQVDGKVGKTNMIGHHWDEVWTFVQRARTARNGKLLIIALPVSIGAGSSRRRH